MNPPEPSLPPEPSPSPAPGSAVGSELLVLPDGRILAHHLTPELAEAVRQALARPDPS